MYLFPSLFRFYCRLNRILNSCGSWKFNLRTKKKWWKVLRDSLQVLVFIHSVGPLRVLTVKRIGMALRPSKSKELRPNFSFPLLIPVFLPVWILILKWLAIKDTISSSTRWRQLGSSGYMWNDLLIYLLHPSHRLICYPFTSVWTEHSNSKYFIITCEDHVRKICWSGITIYNNYDGDMVIMISKW